MLVSLVAEKPTLRFIGNTFQQFSYIPRRSARGASNISHFELIRAAVHINKLSRCIDEFGMPKRAVEDVVGSTVEYLESAALRDELDCASRQVDNVRVFLEKRPVKLYDDIKEQYVRLTSRPFTSNNVRYPDWRAYSETIAERLLSHYRSLL